MRHIASWILATALWLVSVASYAQVGALDQSSSYNNAGFNAGASSLVWQQQIKAGISGQLEGITIQITGSVGASTAIRVRLGAAPSVNPVLFSTNVTKVTPNVETVFVDMTSAGIALNVNDVFVMEIQGNDTGCGMNGNYIAPPGVPLYSEPLYLNGALYSNNGWRLGFMTYMLTCVNGNACDDGNPCTTDDVCQNSVCSGLPVVCFALDDCHDVGVCNPGSGCTNPAKADGTACDDGDLCTQTDSCQAGICTGDNAVTCPAMDACHEDGSCDPQTGSCDNLPTKPDGSPCPGGVCNAGTCEAGTGGSGGGSGGAGGDSGPSGDDESVDQSGGCGCRVVGSSANSVGVVALMGILAVLGRRRKKNR